MMLSLVISIVIPNLSIENLNEPRLVFLSASKIFRNNIILSYPFFDVNIFLRKGFSLLKILIFVVYYKQNKRAKFYIYNAIKTKKSLAYRGVVRYNNSSRVFRKMKTFFDFYDCTVRASPYAHRRRQWKFNRELRFTERNGLL